MEDKKKTRERCNVNSPKAEMKKKRRRKKEGSIFICFCLIF
jgi:hypothetical protein